MKEGFNRAWHYFFEPRMALFIFILFLIMAMVFLDKEGSFENFFVFGPSKDPEKQATFMHMKIDTWHKVILLYVICFMLSIMRTYYQTVMRDFIHSYAWNRAIKKIDYSKKWTYIICSLEPIIFFILSIIEFFVLFTRQFQFLFIQFFGDFIIDIPYTFYRLSFKKFTQP
jgi:hypothetical protein